MTYSADHRPSARLSRGWPTAVVPVLTTIPTDQAASTRHNNPSLSDRRSSLTHDTRARRNQDPAKPTGTLARIHPTPGTTTEPDHQDRPQTTPKIGSTKTGLRQPPENDPRQPPETDRHTPNPPKTPNRSVSHNLKSSTPSTDLTPGDRAYVSRPGPGLAGPDRTLTPGGRAYVSRPGPGLAGSDRTLAPAGLLVSRGLASGRLGLDRLASGSASNLTRHRLDRGLR